MIPFWLVLVATVFLSFPWETQAAARELCPGVEWRGASDPELTETERTLVCGKPDLKGTKFQAWSDVPLGQAELHFRSFLETRGHLLPRFSREGNKLVVDPGPVVALTQVELAPGTSSDIAALLPVASQESGQTLTPALLTELEDWAEETLQNQGYPCARASAQAEARTGSVRLAIDPGKRANFGPISIEPVASFDSRALTRYFAFEADQLYDLSLLQVTEDRISESGVLERTEFVPSCDPPGALRLQHEEGGPRLLIYSISASTETVVDAGALFRYTRIGPNASQAEAELRASARRQRARAQYLWYFSSPESRYSLAPEIVAERRTETPFGFWSETGRVLLRRDWDRGSTGLRAAIGPEFTAHQIFRDAFGERDVEALSLAGELALETHTYELYRDELPEGFALRLRATSRTESLLSDYTAHKVSLSGERNWKPKGLSALRVRTLLETTFAPDRDLSLLPPDLRTFLGGFQSVRGFDRLEVPARGPGALSSWHLGVEARPEWLPPGFSPLLFADAGMLGFDSLEWEDPIYASPGIGVEWRSPVGPVTATVARGFVLGDETQASPDEHWQFFIGIGESF